MHKIYALKNRGQKIEGQNSISSCVILVQRLGSFRSADAQALIDNAVFSRRFRIRQMRPKPCKSPQ